MYVRPEDFVRQHQSELLDEACRARSASRVRAERRRQREPELAISTRRGTDDLP